MGRTFIFFFSAILLTGIWAGCANNPRSFATKTSFNYGSVLAQEYRELLRSEQALEDAGLFFETEAGTGEATAMPVRIRVDLPKQNYLSESEILNLRIEHLVDFISRSEHFYDQIPFQGDSLDRSSGDGELRQAWSIKLDLARALLQNLESL